MKILNTENEANKSLAEMKNEFAVKTAGCLALIAFLPTAISIAILYFHYN